MTKVPDRTISLAYKFLGEENFEYDFENVQYSEPDCDRLKTKGLHQVRSQVEFKSRTTILQPDLFERLDRLSLLE